MTILSGANASSSLLAGAPPRTSQEAVAPSGSTITVQPVSPAGSDQWPTLTPVTLIVIVDPTSRRRIVPISSFEHDTTEW
ncbi:hypothetical protein [Nocardia cyriacigeorgica]|uniref:hypothetical protein n=1 Tax=Nocardia cyriacigeorgica TaxID=135487 RepID=UPI002457D123|nr:hypothetical protein [Nocardia cyriacigeorgica]